MRVTSDMLDRAVAVMNGGGDLQDALEAALAGEPNPYSFTSVLASADHRLLEVEAMYKAACDSHADLANRFDANVAYLKELEAKLAAAESRLASVTRWVLSQPASEQLDSLQNALGRDWTK